MKRRRIAPSDNHDRWLISYADFITLLFALFVLMFASAQSDKFKAKAISEAVREALEHGQLSNALSAVLRQENRSHAAPSPPPPKQLPQAPVARWTQPADLVESFTALQKGLDEELKSGKLQLSLEPRGLVISLREAAFFSSGDDAVAPASLATVGRIAEVVRDTANPLRLEGFTDSMPIHNSRFHSNWELSAARSIAMLELLSRQFQVPLSRMSVAGYAENAPVDDNATEQGRARNRRVDLVLLSKEAALAEPRAKPQ